jgi:hypothetical protein
MNALWLMRNSRLIVGLGPSNKRAARRRPLLGSWEGGAAAQKYIQAPV